jgi:hypothetical protein
VVGKLETEMKIVKEPDVLYVVFEECRGMGVRVQGVFSDLEKAEKLCLESTKYFIDVSYVNEIGEQCE